MFNSCPEPRFENGFNFGHALQACEVPGSDSPLGHISNKLQGMETKVDARCVATLAPREVLAVTLQWGQHLGPMPAMSYKNLERMLIGITPSVQESGLHQIINFEDLHHNLMGLFCSSEHN